MVSPIAAAGTSGAPAIPLPKRSLRAQVVNWLLVLFGILLLVSFAVSYIAAVDFANLPYDRQLLATARAIASLARPASAGLAFELPEASRLQLLVDEEDKIYYKVIAEDGSTLGGDALLPPLSVEDNQLQPELTTTEIGGIPMRLATVQRAVPGAQGGARVSVQVAETLNKRTALARQIFFKLLIPQILLAALPIGGLWLGVGSGLAPLERLKHALTGRPQYDLSPLPIEEDTPDELRPLIEAFNEMLARLQTLLSSQQRFVADAAHQLRTPLAGLKTQAELALRLDDHQGIQNALRQVLAAAERGSTLANQLLALARHEQGPHDHLAFKTLDLNRIVQEATEPHVQSALRKRIDLGFEPHARAIAVSGEPISLCEMIGNLIDNAVHYTQAGGRITASVKREGAFGVVMVEDNGPGVAAVDRAHVFERFYRGMDTQVPGSGLGLSIVQEIARVHGGEAACLEGADGKGARFCIRLPLVDERLLSGQKPSEGNSPGRARSLS